jgi:phosphoglycerate dehydrogenase-like enzyme
MTSPHRPIIVVLDDFEHAARSCADWSRVERAAELRTFHTPLRGAALIEALLPAAAIVLMRERSALNAEVIRDLPNLKYVLFSGNRNEAVDIPALRARGIPVSCTRFGPSRISACEQAWALILAATRRLPQNEQAVRRGEWREPRVWPTMLHGERFGVVGLGEIGSRMDAVAQAFGMDVVAWSPHMTMARAAARDAKAVSFDELLETSKVISLHLVASEATRHLFNAERFARMRADSIFVNTSHPSLVDEAALVAALNRGRPGAAALDVFSVEPLPAGHALMNAPNLVLSPHLGFVGRQVLEQFYSDAAESMLAWLSGQPLLREVWPPNPGPTSLAEAGAPR